MVGQIKAATDGQLVTLGGSDIYITSSCVLNTNGYFATPAPEYPDETCPTNNFVVPDSLDSSTGVLYAPTVDGLFNQSILMCEYTEYDFCALTRTSTGATSQETQYKNVYALLFIGLLVIAFGIGTIKGGQA